MATVREPVPVFIFFQYGKPYPLSISSRTQFSFLPVWEPVLIFNFFQYGKQHPLSKSSRTRFSFLIIWEHEWSGLVLGLELGLGLGRY